MKMIFVIKVCLITLSFNSALIDILHFCVICQSVIFRIEQFSGECGSRRQTLEPSVLVCMVVKSSEFDETCQFYNK